MVKIKPFAGIRPPKELAAEVSSRPYDVLNSQEAKAEATERSLLHIIKPEIDFDPIADEHDEKVYKKGKFQEVARQQVAGAGWRRALLYLCPDDEWPYPVRSGHVLLL